MGGVLLIDDDEDLLAAMGDLIAALGAAPVVALRSLAELVDAAPRALRCELAIVDVNLGAGVPTGLDVYEWLRARSFAGRVAFLTGHAINHPLVRRACRLGAARLYQKPIELRDLVELLGVEAPRPLAHRR